MPFTIFGLAMDEAAKNRAAADFEALDPRERIDTLIAKVERNSCIADVANVWANGSMPPEARELLRNAVASGRYSWEDICHLAVSSAKLAIVERIEKRPFETGRNGGNKCSTSA